MSPRFIVKAAVSGLAMALFAGCAAENVGQVGDRPREAITFAARAKYPGAAQTSDRYKLGAVVDPERKVLDIYNFSSQSIPATAVWVNGAFVRQVSTIAPKGHVTVRYVDLLESGPGTRSFSDLATPMQKVEVQTNDGNYAALGPVNQ
jgi:hypothetical protein